MRPEQFQRLKQLVQAAQELPAGEWAAFLARACADDPELRAQAETFLARERQAPPDFLRDPDFGACLQAARALPASLPDLEVVLADPTDVELLVHGRVVCPGILVVGRMPTANVILPASDRHAARMHFHIELGPSYCRLNNHSTQGTFVNGLLIHSQCDLRHGDLIRASESVFLVQVFRRGNPVELAPSPTVMWEPAGDPTSSLEEAPPPAPPPPALVRLPGYQLIRLLGRGGMGNVWLAEDRKGQPVACKLIRPELALNPESCARFRRETNHLKDLKHRHIVGFREAGESQGLLYLVMDYVDGCSLAELLSQQGPFAVGRAVRLLCQLLEALKEAHNNGVVHRDVKPSNVLVQTSPGAEEVRLADFGMAKVYQSADMAQGLTLPGVVGGTLAFAAPEMVRDFRRAGPLADQYGAAATLYTLLTGCPLHDADNALQLLNCIRTRDVVSLERRQAGLPVGLTDAIHRALDREPMRRFPNVQALHDALLPYAEGAGL
jgi:eukaryotic-like serine/threonine-protein kinase